MINKSEEGNFSVINLLMLLEEIYTVGFRINTTPW